MGKHTVQEYMTVQPLVVSSDRTLAEAHRLMRERNIRHLPVVDHGELVGVVSQRDLYLLETLRGVDPATETVREAMSADPYTVSPDAPLDAVAAVMAEKKVTAAQSPSGLHDDGGAGCRAWQTGKRGRGGWRSGRRAGCRRRRTAPGRTSPRAGCGTGPTG